MEHIITGYRFLEEIQFYGLFHFMVIQVYLKIQLKLKIFKGRPVGDGVIWKFPS